LRDFFIVAGQHGAELDMAQLKLHILKSFRDFDELAGRWNDLWQRSEVTSPIVRAEPLRNWLECFAPGQKVRVIVVEEQDRLMAALPLIGQRWARWIPTGGLPSNEWSAAGDLLLDPSCDADSALHLVARALQQLPWPLYRLPFVRHESPAWQKFRDVLQDTKLGVECRASYDVTYIPAPTDWEAFKRTWSKNHRHRLGGRYRRLKEQGDLRLNRVVPTTLAEALTPLEQAMAIEDGGWKGEAGTSMRKSPGIARYLERLTALLVPRGELEFAFLELNGQPIAFEMLLHAKGVLHSYKVGYDEQYGTYDPGHLLMQEILQEVAHTQRCIGYDCFGPNTVGLRRWRGAIYHVGQLVITPSSLLGRTLMLAYRRSARSAAAISSDRSASESEVSIAGVESAERAESVTA
jgi:CelD/BcsL family acetyltransferase involved in cellulose biosynthesis